MYNKGDKVVFIRNPDIFYLWDLVDYNTYIIDEKLTYNGEIYYSVRDNRLTETSWFQGNDFVSIKEYRKLKLKK